MNLQKWLTVAIYVAMLLGLVFLAGTSTAQIIQWIFFALLIAHFFEFIMVYRLLSDAEGSLSGHFVQTMLFGFMHWFPIRRKEMANTGGQ